MHITVSNRFFFRRPCMQMRLHEFAQFYIYKVHALQCISVTALTISLLVLALHVREVIFIFLAVS